MISGLPCSKVPEIISNRISNWRGFNCLISAFQIWPWVEAHMAAPMVFCPTPASRAETQEYLFYLLISEYLFLGLIGLYLLIFSYIDTFSLFMFDYENSLQSLPWQKEATFNRFYHLSAFRIIRELICLRTAKHLFFSTLQNWWDRCHTKKSSFYCSTSHSGTL